MREFSTREQEIITKLVTNAGFGANYILATIFDDLFKQNCVEYTTGDTRLNFYRNIDTLDSEEISRVFAQIVEISFLITYLIDNRYIYEYYDDEQNTHKVKIGGCRQTGCIKIEQSLYDPTVKKTLTDSSRSIVFVAEDLKSLVNNDFKTPEQIRFETQLEDGNTKHKQTICLTRIAAGVSFAGLLVALILPFSTKTKLAEIEDIKTEIRNAKTELPTVIETRVTNDTLKVNIVKPTSMPKTN